MWRGHSPESFVAKYSGENAGEILQANTCEAVMRGGRPAVKETGKEANLHAPEGEVTVAERRADDPYPDLVRLGRVNDDLLDGQRLPGGPAHGRCSIGENRSEE